MLSRHIHELTKVAKRRRSLVKECRVDPRLAGRTLI
jgi:hypothetical protein